MSWMPSLVSYRQNQLPMERTRAIAWVIARSERQREEQSTELLREVKRWLARNDLFFLLTVVCKRRDLNHDWLFDRCREVVAFVVDYDRVSGFESLLRNHSDQGLSANIDCSRNSRDNARDNN